MFNFLKKGGNNMLKFLAIIASILAPFFGILGLIKKAEKRGEEKQRVQNIEESLKNAEKIRNNTNKLDNTSDDAVREQLHKWTRDDG